MGKALSKRKIKNGWLEEPPASPSSPREERSEAGASHHHDGLTNGVGEEAPAAPPASAERLPADTPPSAAHEPELSASVPPASALPVAPSAASAIPVAKITSLAELSPLEQRVCRLEDALAQLQASQSSRPSPRERFTDHRPAPPAPAPTPAPTPEGKGLLDLVRRSVAPADPPAGVRRHWLLLDAVAELRAMARMFVDPRYRMSKAGWAFSLGLLLAFLFSYWWVPGTSIPLFGYWIDKAVDLALAYALFRVLTREARRYRETAPDLPPSLRL
jgi:hypothetical protein